MLLLQQASADIATARSILNQNKALMRKMPPAGSVERVVAVLDMARAEAVRVFAAQRAQTGSLGPKVGSISRTRARRHAADCDA